MPAAPLIPPAAMLKNIGWMSIATALRMASGFVVFIALARGLGVEQFGLLSYWMALAGLATLPVNYGFGLQVLREVAKDAQSGARVMRDTLAAKIAMSAIVLTLAAAYAMWRIEQPYAFLALLLMFVVESFTEHFNFYFRAKGAFQQETFLATFGAGVSLLLVGGTALTQQPLLWVCLAFLLARVLAFAVALYLALSRQGFQAEGIVHATARTWATLRSGFAYASDFFLSSLNSTLDSVLIANLLGTRELGLYQAGMRLVQGVVAFIPSIAYAYMPSLTAAHAKQAPDLSSLVRGLLRKMLIVGGAGALAFAVAPGPLTHLLYGEKYIELAGYFPWLGLALLLRFLAAAHGAVLTATGYQGSRALINLISMAILVVGIVTLSPVLGLIGVALSLCSSYAFLMMAYLHVMLRNGVPGGWTSGTVMAALGVAGALVWRGLQS